MATATEMTIALGRTLYGAPHDYTDDEDTIEGCETRVSVTWRLTEGDQDLPLTASLLAEKTVQVLETADRTIRCKEEKPAVYEQVPAQNPAVYEQVPAQNPPALSASSPLANGMTSALPLSGAASHGSTVVGNRTAVNGTSGNGSTSRSHTTAYIPRITKTQSLAIQSLCTRHGIADWELKRLVWEQFAKKEQSELTKEQAGELLNLLQQNTAGDGVSGYAYA